MRRVVLFLWMVLPLFASGQIVKTIAGTGAGGYSGDNTSAITAELNSPDALKFDNLGNMYIADEYNHVIRKVNNSGIITTIAGTGTGGHTGDNGLATSAELNRPGNLIFDASGNLYVTEYGNEDIRKIGTTGIITTIAGTGIAGYNGDNIHATAAQLNDPVGLAFDSEGNLFFSDNANHRDRKINISTGIISTVAGTGTPGYAGDNEPATSAEVGLTGYITFSPTGELYIPDYTNHVIRKINSAGIIATVAGTGISGYSGDGLPATAAELTSPFAVIFDPSGNMYISDRALGVIRKIDAATDIITTIAGIGTLGYGGDGGPATSAQFNEDMYCSAVDAFGNLYIADPINNRVRRISYNATGINEPNKTPQNSSIYPNPAHNEITIISTDKIESVEVVNMVGQVVATAPALPPPLKERGVLLSVGFLPSGVYFVKVNGVYAGKFVKE